MNDSLLSAIKAHDFATIRNICFAFSQEERQELKSYLARKNFNFIFREVLEKEKRYHFSNKELALISYTIMCVCNTLREVRKIELFQNIEPYVKGNYYYFLSSLEDEILLDFVQSPQGAYMIEGIQLMYKDNPLKMSFQILWSAYKAGYIALNEEIFIHKMYGFNCWFKSEDHLTEYLLKYPETVVLFPSVPAYIQDTIFATEEWKKIYHTLNEKGYFTNRNSILHAFIEALLNPWKKNVLDMYCRWIEALEPSPKELLANQHTLFALLSSDKTSVINFALKLIKEIADEKYFDFQAFADNFTLCFATQKIAKSQLIGLDILAKHYKQQPPVNIEYREQLAVLFTVPDAKLQEKVASLLTTYFGGEGLPEVVAPYQDYLKGKAQELLQSLPSPNSSETSETACVAHTSESARVARTSESARETHTPRTWDDLLFLIGDCIRERSPLVLDLFFEGLNQLQAQIPADFSQQISPYQKQLGNQPFEFTTYRKCMRWVIDVWEGKASLSDDIFGGKLYNPIPFLREKTKRLLLKLKQGNTLPFVSTPTHSPFYIDPQVYLERIAQYEKAGKPPMWEDVVVGLNRLLPTEITEVQKQLALSLTGEYAPALQYYFEVSKTITVTDATRVLWGQVLRLKDIDGVFPELEIPQKPNLQGLVRPFYLEYEVKPTKIKGLERNKIILEDDWDKKYSTYSLYNDLGANYYNVSPMSKATDEDIDYQLSLNPRYIDGWLCKYLLTYAQGMEGESLTEATRVMSLLLEHHLPIYHGGWLMVATCLLAERKNLRDLTTEYILLSLQRGKMLTYLAEAIGTLLAHKYAPIARFIEFLDLPTRDPKIKAFQKAVVEAYLPLAEKQEKKPTNHKKLVAFCC
ncbi:hypothetical protein SAMN05444420_101670 [Capnocytophaga granulosa]|uniref:Uncharacterized protein n=1 Tax=Capnocytophaga granulosa TaxID=45242 RepID=A0A1H2S7F6_9FLAO|nr:DUF6493 family protein [Capnocytophaga granulosa]EPD30242.1 hypothetical protein HMPREF9331_00883 [Capnocytophaga granulosa ATCC 51502]SDW26889.1 hypothetical protein SAMN05444420_101670 [Capnocytophaga granulosa]SUX20162.1 Uncharacterised protein [Capnocytophaga granulosa]